MVSQLFDPSQSKNLSDFLVLAVLALHALGYAALPSSARRPVFAAIFLFWRTCYNGGIGYLLSVQSRHRRLIAWARNSKVFQNPMTGQNPHPLLYKFLKGELQTKIPENYQFDEVPVEYNTWLLFRRVVDIVLMCDFVSYCLFAIACGGRPDHEASTLTLARWAAGVALIGFNLWVKLDAHRVVKDYAWYWGDFFFLIDQELTFDGVFEMAPHPMYSVGYVGYYGISLLAASYSVLFISLVAHAAQFAFLYFVENPHIEKTYNAPPTRKERSLSAPEQADLVEDESASELSSDQELALPASSTLQPLPVHKLLGLRNLDLCRVTDVSVLLLQFYMLAVTIGSPSTPLYQALFCLHAILWRLWFSAGLGIILRWQSHRKRWTRHFLKFGQSKEEAWRQWKGLYHLSLTMCYASFLAAAWKMYVFPQDWMHGVALLKHVLGAMLIALQIWTAVSIYDSLGEFGWFYGDFFFDHAPKLTYSGIYRFLNNPERVLGLAGIWGAALITNRPPVFFLALFSHISTLCFIHFIERPHMQKLYGQNLRREAGLTRSLKRSLPPPISQWQGNVDKVVGGTVDLMEEFIDAARPRFAASVGSLVKDTKTLLCRYPARLSRGRLVPNRTGFDRGDYSLGIEGVQSSPLAMSARVSGREGENGRVMAERRDPFQTLVFDYGAPIKVKWTAPVDHGKKDWVGLYMVADNASREITTIASSGRWVATNEGAYDHAHAAEGIVSSDVPIMPHEAGGSKKKQRVMGEMIFEGDKLWWTHGVFEFRYHHDGGHNVMAISLPFEIYIARFRENSAEFNTIGSTRGAIEKALLTVVQNCFDRDPEIAPSSVEESYGPLAERDGKYAKRVVFAVHQMFGVEFAPQVVQADGNVRNLTWRICNARKVLHVSDDGENQPDSAR
ncbi:MAG: phosphatidylethanolamine N-methyltransferase [Phylliscum demangeonii]|nr:MAG: phosphatidylethanolamine N-methyltransferase [Phylliscum demangeonii]